MIERFNQHCRTSADSLRSSETDLLKACSMTAVDAKERFARIR